MAALQRMVGGAELTEDTMRTAIASLTPEQRRQLLSEGQDLKRDLLTKQELTEKRNLYFKEVNRSADKADLPVDKDGAFIAKKVRLSAHTAASLRHLCASLRADLLARRGRRRPIEKISEVALMAAGMSMLRAARCSSGGRA